MTEIYRFLQKRREDDPSAAVSAIISSAHKENVAPNASSASKNDSGVTNKRSRGPNCDWTEELEAKFLYVMLDMKSKGLLNDKGAAKGRT